MLVVPCIWLLLCSNLGDEFGGLTSRLGEVGPRQTLRDTVSRHVLGGATSVAGVVADEERVPGGVQEAGQRPCGRNVHIDGQLVGG